MMQNRQKLISRRSNAVINIAFGILFGVSRAHAQNAQAERLFEEGNKLMADGKLAQACAAFEASNRVEPRAGTLIQLGECRERNQQLASAWSAYKDAWNQATDPRKQKYATSKAAALEPRLSYLTVAVSDQSRIRGLVVTRNGASLDPMLWNRALPVDGGDHVITARAPGCETWQRQSMFRWRVRSSVSMCRRSRGPARSRHRGERHPRRPRVRRRSPRRHRIRRPPFRYRLQ